MSYDLADFRLLAAIADCGSLTGAAVRVSLATSSASARLTHLESALQVRLFTRLARGLTPTAAGETMIRHARQVLARLGQLEVDLAPYAACVPDHVTVLANSSAIDSFLPGDLAGFLHDKPEMRLCIEERPSLEVARAIGAGEAALGIAALATIPAGIDTPCYRTERLVLLVPPGHPIARAGTCSFGQMVADQPFICLSTGSSFHTFMMNVAATCGARLDVRIQVRSHAAVCDMVAAGMGIGVVPLAVAQRKMAKGEVPFVTMPIAEAWAERRLYLCTQSGWSLPGPAVAIVEYLRQCAHFRFCPVR